MGGVVHVFQECRGWHEEQGTGYRPAEVEPPIIIAGRAADEHVLDHLLGHPRRAAIANEVGAIFTGTDSAEGHVVAHDLKLFAILGNRGERVVRRRRFYRVVQFDVGQLAAADDALLHLRGERVPSVQVMEIFLHDYVAAPSERGILLADECGVDHRFATRILGAIDEAQEVAVIEVPKAMNLVDRRDRFAEARHNLRRHFEAKIHPLRADMEQQVPWRRNRMVLGATDLAERVEFGWARVPEQPLPRIGPDPHHAGKAGFEVAKLHCANQRWQVCAKRSHSRAIVRARIYRHDQKHRRAGERCRYRLCKSHSVNLREVFRIGIWRTQPDDSARFAGWSQSPLPCRTRSAFLKPKIAQARVIIGTAAKRPVIFALALPDREVVYAGDAQAHKAMRIELPVLVAITAKPVAAIIVP